MDHLNSNMANPLVFRDVFGLFVCLFVFVNLSVFFFFFFGDHVVLLNEELSILLSLVDLENVYILTNAIIFIT